MFRSALNVRLVAAQNTMVFDQETIVRNPRNENGPHLSVTLLFALMLEDTESNYFWSHWSYLRGLCLHCHGRNISMCMFLIAKWARIMASHLHWKLVTPLLRKFTGSVHVKDLLEEVD